MSAADDANQRLDAALSRLQSSLQARLASQDGAGQAQLEDEMTAVRSEFASLKDTTAVVSQRLDAAIGKIKGMLAE
jgi:outer membrane murein-binding lipoprotein Lpp